MSALLSLICHVVEIGRLMVHHIHPGNSLCHALIGKGVGAIGIRHRCRRVGRQLGIGKYPAVGGAPPVGATFYGRTQGVRDAEHISLVAKQGALTLLLSEYESVAGHTVVERKGHHFKPFGLGYHLYSVGDSLKLYIACHSGAEKLYHAAEEVDALRGHMHRNRPRMIL